MNCKQLRRIVTGTAGLALIFGTVSASDARTVSTTQIIEGIFPDNETQILNVRQSGLLSEPLRLAQQQQPRVALVIGNADYEDDPLANPINDATAIHQALGELGFDMLPLVTNADKREMVNAIGEFQDRLEAGAVGVFYYAGHGVQVNGINYLVPLEAELKREADAEFDAVDVNRVIQAMDSADTAFNVLIIDACRDNPFYRRWRRTRGSNTRGLTVERPPRGTLIAYATEPNNVAEDGDDGDRHSPFTQSLLAHLRTPEISILDMLTRVTADVIEATGDRQSPYFEGNPVGFFSFNPSPNVSALPDPSPIEPPPTPVSPPTPPAPSPPAMVTALASAAQAGDWQEADAETRRLLLELGDQNDSGGLSISEVEALSCDDLRAIDQQWVEASDGKFGFSVQARIWQEVGSPTRYNEQWEEFGDRVGWRVDDRWIAYSEVTFDTSSPEGHLPGWGGFVGFLGVWGRGRVLSSAALCEL